MIVNLLPHFEFPKQHLQCLAVDATVCTVHGSQSTSEPQNSVCSNLDYFKNGILLCFIFIIEWQAFVKVLITVELMVERNNQT